MMAMLLVTLFFSAGVAVNSIPATVLVEPRETVCFSKFAKEETRFSLDVFVFQGDGIGVTVHYRHGGEKPKNIFSAKIFSTGDNLQDGHKFEAKHPGEYEICLANDHRFEQGTKHVMLNITEKTEDAARGPSEPTNGQTKESKDKTEIGNRLETLKEKFDEMRKRQMEERKSLAFREAAAEGNHKSMVRSSIMETVVLLLVSVGQIFFVRRWFQGKGTLLKQWS